MGKNGEKCRRWVRLWRVLCVIHADSGEDAFLSAGLREREKLLDGTRSVIFVPAFLSESILNEPLRTFALSFMKASPYRLKARLFRDVLCTTKPVPLSSTTVTISLGDALIFTLA